jgi:hypothetical protein
MQRIVTKPTDGNAGALLPRITSRTEDETNHKKDIKREGMTTVSDTKSRQCC